MVVLIVCLPVCPCSGVWHLGSTWTTDRPPKRHCT